MLNTPALTGNNCMIEQPNLAMKLDIWSLQTTTYHAKQGMCSLQTTKRISTEIELNN